VDSGRFILVLKCPDVKGVVAAVAGFLTAHDCSITNSHQFHDASDNLFYLRAEFTGDGPAFTGLADMKGEFQALASRFSMLWELIDASVPTRILIGVSRIGHCLFDLLHRWRTGLLDVAIPAVFSNHDDMRSFVEWNSIPFHHLPVDASTRRAQERRILDLVEEHSIDLVVLARYMQVLSPDMCSALAGKCINIHHSFLPSFKGQGPYSQAYERGVKIIGATAHYVTSDLDEGPIIEQDVQRVSHAHTPADLIRIGRDIESVVLARAVRWHVERRIMLNGAKTVVFS
jgi:formyltetrahydrofolate deformylase